MAVLNAAASRSRDGGPSFSPRNRLIRAAWQVCWLVAARWTPRPLAPWRRFLLRSFGASMAPGSDVRGSARVWLPSNLKMGRGAVIGPKVDCYNQGVVALGDSAIVSQGAHLCAGTHDVDDPHFQLVTRPIEIGASAWIAADAFVGPGCLVGQGAVLGARAVAFGRLEAHGIYAGNPAKLVRRRAIRPVAGPKSE